MAYFVVNDHMFGVQIGTNLNKVYRLGLFSWNKSPASSTKSTFFSRATVSTSSKAAKESPALAALRSSKPKWLSVDTITLTISSSLHVIIELVTHLVVNEDIPASQMRREYVKRA
jgi:hypothetical protein